MQGELLRRDPDAPAGAELLHNQVHDAMRQAAPAAAAEARGAPSNESGGRADGASEGVETEEGERRRGAAARCPRRHGGGPHHGPETKGGRVLVRRPRNAVSASRVGFWLANGDR